MQDKQTLESDSDDAGANLANKLADLQVVELQAQLEGIMNKKSWFVKKGHIQRSKLLSPTLESIASPTLKSDGSGN